MTAQAIGEELRTLGDDNYKRIIQVHGIPDPCYGVKVEYLKRFEKQIKKDYKLSLDLFDSGVYDAMYLAGLIADEAKMTREDLQGWMKKATCGALTTCTVAWIAAESRFGRELALEWIESNDEGTACGGWSTLSSLVSIKPDSELDLEELRRLLQRVRTTINDQPNGVRQAMNGFLIAVGCYVAPLSEEALAIGEELGKLDVKMTAGCKLPFAPDCIRKVQARGTIGKKRKMARC
jgi:3-methyladenine DNA glycosylase AlkD